jgi:predicted ribonuclease toxin of YeeF-YezG toxin-antitoxin module
MSYVGYVIEETMHAKQAEIARQAEAYPIRAAARAARGESDGRSWQSLFSRSRRTGAVPCARAADVAAAC